MVAGFSAKPFLRDSSMRVRRLTEDSVPEEKRRR